MEINTVGILRKELVGKKLIMYDNNIVRASDGKVKTLWRTFQPSKREDTENVRVELLITDVNEANRDAKSENGCHIQIETGTEVHATYYFSNFEIED